MGYLLDTNIVSDLMRQPNGKIAQGIRAVSAAATFTSIIVVSEIRFGLANKPSRALEQQFTTILAKLTVLDFSPPADEFYAQLRRDLQAQGKLIGALDMLIAAQALAGDHTLVSANEREFSRIAGLRVENWLR